MKKILFITAFLCLSRMCEAEPNIFYGFGPCFSYSTITGWSIPYIGSQNGCTNMHLYLFARPVGGSPTWFGPFTPSGGSFLIPNSITTLTDELNNGQCLEVSIIAICGNADPEPWADMPFETRCPCSATKVNCIADFSGTVATSWFDDPYDYIYYKDQFPAGFYPPFTLTPYPNTDVIPCFIVVDTWTFDNGNTNVTVVYDNKNNPGMYTGLSLNGFYTEYNLGGPFSYEDDVCHSKVIYETNNCSFYPAYGQPPYEIKLVDSCKVCQHFCVSAPHDYVQYNHGEGKSGSNRQLNQLSPNNLFIFPNPAMGEVNVSFNSSSAEDVEIHIKDINGKELKSYIQKSKVGKNEFNINTGILTPGNYLLQFVSPTMTFTKKITSKE